MNDTTTTSNTTTFHFFVWVGCFPNIALQLELLLFNKKIDFHKMSEKHKQSP